MVAGLKVFKEDGTILIDTTRITYGLVKSGYLAATTGWNRKQLKSAQLDPNNGANWEDSALVDSMWSISITGAQSPVVFLAGEGLLQGVSVSGTTTTFIFSSASTSTKAYIFDLMANALSGPGLKCYAEDGTLTFNSLQITLNVVAAVQAPAKGAASANGAAPAGSVVTTYAGGYNVKVANAGATAGVPPQVLSKVDISLGAEEFAAYLPYSRTCGVWDQNNNNSAAFSYGMVEGACGYVGGVRFMFGPSGASTVANTTFGTIYLSVPDVFPVALVIRTSNLPFPFG